MKKLLLSSVVLCGIACSVAFAAHEFRTPLSLTRKGAINYPLQPVDDTEWFELLEYENDYPKWSLNTWGGLYSRCATDAFLCKRDCCCPIEQLAPDPCADPCKCPDKGNLTTLFVGKECFKGAEAFANGVVTDVTNINFTPFLNFSTLCPRFTYNEKGYVWGIDGTYQFGCKNRWHVGARLGVPYKVVDIDSDCCCLDDSGEEGLDSVVAECAFNLDADSDRNDIDYAYRLDFLSSLVRTSIPGTDSQLLVEYDVGGPPNSQETRIAGVPVTSDNTMDATAPPVYLLKSTNGAIPAKPFNRERADVNLALTAAGTNGADGDALFFNVSTDYLNGGLATDIAAQSQLFVVPRRETAPVQLSDQSQAIRNAVREILDTLETRGLASTTEFFKKFCCIDICSPQHVQGLGDVDAEIYGGWQGKWGYADLILGFKLPTGKENKNPRRVFFVPTGNNKHFEVKGGAEFGFNWRFLALNVFGFGGHAFQRCRPKAAPFKCATVKNIGPCVPAEVSWNYGHVAVDVTFFHPQTREVGGTIGYEFYGRGKDNICLPCCTATDCLGNENDLDACVLERCTDTQSHKVRGEGFCRWNWCELFIGSSYVFSGRNVMREVEGHAGMKVYF